MSVRVCACGVGGWGGGGGGGRAVVILFFIIHASISVTVLN